MGPGNSQESAIRHEMRGPAALVGLNRPSVHNAFDSTVLKELSVALAAVQANMPRVIVFYGMGPSFCSGSDLNALRGGGSRYEAEHTQLGQQVFGLIETLPQVTVAVVHGYCLGGGLEMAAAMDVRITTGDASWGLPEILLGAVPSLGSTHRLARLVGQARMKHLLLTGERISGETAEGWGLATRIVADQAEGIEWATTLAARLDPIPMELVRGLKLLATRTYEMGPNVSMEMERLIGAFEVLTKQQKD